MMLDQYLDQFFQLKQVIETENTDKTFRFDESLNWPRADKQIVLGPDTAIELGSPQAESLAFMLWTETQGKINDERITIIGPELNESNLPQMPFAKIILVQGHGFNEDNAYERCQEMELIRFQLNLDGYMLRAVPQESKEWSRISKTAMRSGFSLKMLGNELVRAYKELAYVDAVEVLFITASKELVQTFKPLGQKVGRTIQAMNKIFDDLEFDCSHCSFKDVCDDIDGMKEMHKKAQAG